MAGLSITGQMKVSTLQEGFLKEFGLTLRVYDGRSFADPTQTLGQVRKKKGSGKALSVAKNMKVGNLEDKLEEEFGLKVQVAGSDDSYLCDDNLTLNAAYHKDEKKMVRKARKETSQIGVSESTKKDQAEETIIPTIDASNEGLENEAVEEIRTVPEASEDGTVIENKEVNGNNGFAEEVELGTLVDNDIRGKISVLESDLAMENYDLLTGEKLKIDENTVKNKIFSPNEEHASIKDIDLLELHSLPENNEKSSANEPYTFTDLDLNE